LKIDVKKQYKKSIRNLYFKVELLGLKGQLLMKATEDKRKEEKQKEQEPINKKNSNYKTKQWLNKRASIEPIIYQACC
jgi:hypothetical protein